MSTFIIHAHGRLQEWVAEEKGYFAAEGLTDYALSSHGLLSPDHVRDGCSRRCGPCTKAVISRATLVQMTPSVNGIASEPRTFVMRPSSTVTVRLQVSGQSKVQTLACSSRDIRGLRAETATIDYPYVWSGGLQHPVRAG